jgi:release factor glutamine methyltransferase
MRPVHHDYGVSASLPDKSRIRLFPVRQAVTAAISVLSRAGIPSPLTDAHELLAYVLGVPRVRIAAVSGLTADQMNRFRALTVERARRVPLQYLTGSAPFRYAELAVGPGVFVPRPETELLAGWGLDAIAAVDAPLVVDLCSGSGAIAVSVAGERPQARVYAVERDPAALEWLRRNADGTRVEVIAGDATDPAVLSELDGQVDVLLCNPPYVPAGTPVPPEVADHDPAVAVFGGPDGLDVIRGIVARAATLVRPGGAVAIEHDDTHATAVPDLLRSGGRFTHVEEHRDLAGRPRFATARRMAD